jgi:hypothetical protein
MTQCDLNRDSPAELSDLACPPQEEGTATSRRSITGKDTFNRVLKAFKSMAPCGNLSREALPTPNFFQG